MEDHFLNLQRLLTLEAAAEKEAALAQIQRNTGADSDTGGALVQLVVRQEESGLGGRALLTLAKRNQSQGLPWTPLGPGTPVILSEEGLPAGPEASGWRGLVTRINRQEIQIGLDRWPEPVGDRPTFRLDRASDEIGRTRLREALEQARTAKAGSRLAQLRQILLGQEEPRFETNGSARADSPLFHALNPAQAEAVQFALGAQDVALIHGPPGTGKTTTAVALIQALVQRGERVLACAPSNLAVDNLVERLAAAGESVLRLGHPARVSPALQEHTLDLMVQNHPDMAVAEKLQREARALHSQASRYTRAKPERGSRQALRQEARAMQADARRLESQVVARILDGAAVVCATLTGLDSRLLGERRFDCCVMDEASQSSEPAAWIPLQYVDRLVLAGDPCQLPPTVISPQAARQGLNVSLMERLMAQAGLEIGRQLVVQHRMHRAIMDFSSAHFYDHTLAAHPDVADHLLVHLDGVAESELTATPVRFIDTAGAGYDEALEPEGESRLNPQEADLAVSQVRKLLAAGVDPAAMGVITPYAAQVRLLREMLEPLGVDADSVDGFQGREKEAVIISLVRANERGEMGFLADTRRMNVALTRARRKLIVIGDSATITAHPFYRALVDYFDRMGAYGSVWEEEMDW